MSTMNPSDPPSTSTPPPIPPDQLLTQFKTFLEDTRLPSHARLVLTYYVLSQQYYLLKKIAQDTPFIVLGFTPPTLSHLNADLQLHNGLKLINNQTLHPAQIMWLLYGELSEYFSPGIETEDSIDNPPTTPIPSSH